MSLQTAARVAVGSTAVLANVNGGAVVGEASVDDRVVLARRRPKPVDPVALRGKDSSRGGRAARTHTTRWTEMAGRRRCGRINATEVPIVESVEACVTTITAVARRALQLLALCCPACLEVFTRRAKEVSQSGGVCIGVRGCFAFLPFSNQKITMEIPDVFLYIDSLRKCYIAHCYLPSP